MSVFQEVNLLGGSLKEEVGPRIRVNPHPFPHLLVNKEFAAGHPLERKITSPGKLRRRDLQRLLDPKVLKTTMLLSKAGAVPASANLGTHYAGHGWYRDAAIKASALIKVGKVSEGLSIIVGQVAHMTNPSQRERLIKFIFSPNAKERFLIEDDDVHPHIRYGISEDGGEPFEKDELWGHNQLDAIGLPMQRLFKYANEELVDLEHLDTALTETVNPDNRLESIFALLPKFLHKIEYWDQKDKGPWEWVTASQRAFSIGVVLEMFLEAKKYFDRVGYDAFDFYDEDGRKNPDRFKEIINEGIQKGEEAFNRRVPPSGEFAVECDETKVDAALAFLLLEFGPPLNIKQQDAIVRAIENECLGDVGIARYQNDDYVGMDYIYHTGRDESFWSDTSAPDYKSAEWTLFDHMIAAHYYQRYLNLIAELEPGSPVSEHSTEQFSGLSPEQLESEARKSFIKADLYLKRAISQITHEPDTLRKANGEEITVPACAIPEAYFWDSTQERWRPNENSPLHMAEATFSMLLITAARAMDVRERRDLRKLRQERRTKAG